MNTLKHQSVIEHLEVRNWLNKIINKLNHRLDTNEIQVLLEMAAFHEKLADNIKGQIQMDNALSKAPNQMTLNDEELTHIVEH